MVSDHSLLRKSFEDLFEISGFNLSNYNLGTLSKSYRIGECYKDGCGK